MTWLTNPYRFGAALPPFTVATLTIPAAAVGSDLTGFPVLVDLADMPAGFWAAVASDGSDIRLTDSDGNGLPLDVVAIDTGTETGKLFFRADLLTAASNIFYVQAGSGASAPAPSDPLGRNAVYSAAGYLRFFAFAGASVVDRCGSGDDLTLAGGATLTGGRLDTEASGAYAVCDAPDAPTNWIMGAILTEGDPTSNQSILRYQNASDNNRSVLLYRSLLGGGPCYALFNDTDGDANSRTGNIGSPIDRTFIAGYQTGATQRGIYWNGSLEDTDTTSGLPNTSPLFLKLSFESGDGLKGKYELAYLRDATPTTAWMAAEYESWFAPATFYSVS